MPFKDPDHLLPCIVQNETSGQVLMLGYMNQQSYQLTLSSKKVTFFSRSRQKIWQKGETSGHFLTYKSSSWDCDKDTLLVLAQPQGPTCHLGTDSCFTKNLKPKNSFLSDLETIIADKKKKLSENSYTSSLIKQGIERIAQKVGEEGVEVCIAAISGDPQTVIEESADLIYHLLVLLRFREISLDQVIECLASRNSN